MGPFVATHFPHFPPIFNLSIATVLRRQVPRRREREGDPRARGHGGRSQQLAPGPRQGGDRAGEGEGGGRQGGAGDADGPSVRGRPQGLPARPRLHLHRPDRSHEEQQRAGRVERGRPHHDAGMERMSLTNHNHHLFASSPISRSTHSPPLFTWVASSCSVRSTLRIPST